MVPEVLWVVLGFGIFKIGLDLTKFSRLMPLMMRMMGSKSGVMRGFQKGITLGGRTSRSVWKVYGGVGWGGVGGVERWQYSTLTFVWAGISRSCCWQRIFLASSRLLLSHVKIQRQKLRTRRRALGDKVAIKGGLVSVKLERESGRKDSELEEGKTSWLTVSWNVLAMYHPCVKISFNSQPLYSQPSQSLSSPLILTSPLVLTSPLLLTSPLPISQLLN